jgi:DNA-binding GntR family transcriptional regulator
MSAIVPPPGRETPHRRDGGSVGRAVNAITDLIARRELVPGEQVRQEDLGERLGLSRGPVREALNALSTQRVLRHEPNRGYFVARFSADDMRQIYLLRRLAETELLRTVRIPSDDELETLRAADEVIARADRVDELTRANDLFHLTIFELSPLTLVRDAVIWGWRTSSAYRAMSLRIGDREGMVVDHLEIVEALRTSDADRLIEISDRHRARSETSLLPLLA